MSLQNTANKYYSFLSFYLSFVFVLVGLLCIITWIYGYIEYCNICVVPFSAATDVKKRKKSRQKHLIL